MLQRKYSNFNVQVPISQGGDFLSFFYSADGIYMGTLSDRSELVAPKASKERDKSAYHIQGIESTYF